MNQTGSARNIGKLLLDEGKLKLSDIELVERYREEQGLSFGDAAVKLGLVSEVDIQRAVAELFEYPYLKQGDGEVSEDLVVAYHPFSAEAEAIRNLRSQLMLLWFKDGQKQLAVLGLGTGRGGSLLTANLAILFSQLGQRTVLVDANLRDPCQHELFNVAPSAGLSELLVGRVGMEAIRKIPCFADLSVLTAGTLPPNPQELLGRPSFKQLLSVLVNDYDIIILDTPESLRYADTQTIAAVTGAVLLVVGKNQTRISDALALQTQLADTKARILGVVLNED